MGRGACPQLRGGCSPGNGVAVLIELREHAVGRHGLELRPGEGQPRRIELQQLCGGVRRRGIAPDLGGMGLGSMGLGGMGLGDVGLKCR